MKHYYVYIMTNKSRTLYTGITNDLVRRIFEHKYKLVEGFAKKYNITRLVWYEEFNNARDAIECEKRIKGWVRKKKVSLIESKNPTWKDLSMEWFRDSSASPQTYPERNHEILPLRCTQGQNDRKAK
jgi:putative endonuclease